MDQNKAEVLRQIGYNVRPCCGLCRYAEVSDGGWGVCLKHKYKHLKHTGEERYLSINIYGSCPFFELSDMAPEVLGKFMEFVEGWNDTKPRGKR